MWHEKTARHAHTAAKRAERKRGAAQGQKPAHADTAATPAQKTHSEPPKHGENRAPATGTGNPQRGPPTKEGPR
ncbi:MAG: hypothetical protein IAF00_02820 [Phycisphaerales bacterium]|nr:hypothetical protein [Phycisphaerales bacterium]